MLDALRRGDGARCESVLLQMDEIYAVLVTMDYPDALTGQSQACDRRHTRDRREDAG